MELAGQRPPERRAAPPPRPPPPGSTAQEDGSHHETPQSIKAFHKLHDKAFAAVQKGLGADEEGNLAAAEQYYAACLPLLDQTLAVDCENLPEASSSEKDTIKQMQQKMNKTRLQIGYRLESLRGSSQSEAYPETSLTSSEDMAVRLPSYDEAVSPSGQSSLMSDAALGDSIMSADYPDLTGGQRYSTEGTELFSVADGVQIFHITPQGYVSAPSYPEAMHVVRLQEGGGAEAASNTPPAFIQVGEWFYPLIPGTSPVLHTTYNAYLFPDLSPGATGSSVGLMLPETMTPDERHCLDDILRSLSAVHNQGAIEPEDLVIPSAPEESSSEEWEPQHVTVPKTVTDERTRQQQQPVAEDKTTSAKIARGITVASKWISWGVGKGAEKAGELITYGSTKLRDKLQPEKEARPVDPRVQKGMVYARKATHVAVSVSGYIVNKLGEATMALGRQVAPHLRKKGEQLLPKSAKTEKGKSRMDGVIEVAASGLQGFGTVYMGLEGAAKALARSLANETVTTVHHKYGEHAGKLTENVVYATGNLALTAYNAENLGIKAVAKRAAKDTGKAVLQDMQERQTGNQSTNAHVNGAGYDGSSSISNDSQKKAGYSPT